MKNKLRASIVIREHNQAGYLERLLKRIILQKKVRTPEIVLIDSYSTDNTEEISKKYGCKLVKIKPSEFTHAYTFNLGVREAKNEIVVYASVDIIPKDDLWLHNLLKGFSDRKVAGIFGKQEPLKNFNFIEEFKIKKMFPDNEVSPANFSNANGAIRKSVWNKIKYNEKIPYQYIGGEDQIWAVQAKKKGYRILYEPKAAVYHSHNYRLKTRLSTAYMNGLNNKAVRKWNRGVFIMPTNKKGLIKYLIKKKAWNNLFFDLILGGILMRLYFSIGRIKSKLFPST